MEMKLRPPLDIVMRHGTPLEVDAKVVWFVRTAGSQAAPSAIGIGLDTCPTGLHGHGTPRFFGAAGSMGACERPLGAGLCRSALQRAAPREMRSAAVGAATPADRGAATEALWARNWVGWVLHGHVVVQVFEGQGGSAILELRQASGGRASLSADAEPPNGTAKHRNGITHSPRRVARVPQPHLQPRADPKLRCGERGQPRDAAAGARSTT